MLYGSVGRVGLRALLGTSFSPLSLFASNEPGGWYDPSDLTTMFQDAAGTTAAALEQPVGLVLDKSRGGTPSARLNRAIYSEAFSTTWGSGNLTLLSGQGDPNGGTSAFRLEANSSVGLAQLFLGTTLANVLDASGQQTVSLYAKAGTASFITISTFDGGVRSENYFNVSAGTVGTINQSGGSGAISSAGNGWYRCSVTYTPASVPDYYAFAICDANNSSGITAGRQAFVFGFDARAGVLGTYQKITTGVNGEWVPGNHLSQSTSTARPVLSARVNLLTYSEDFRNTAAAGETRPWTWAKASISANAINAPNGTLTADKLVEDNTSGLHQVYHSVNASSGQTFSIYAKSAERSVLGIYSGAWFSFNLSTGVATGSGATITSVGDGWYQCAVPVSATTQIFFGPATQTVTNDTTWAYAGNGTSGIYIWGADLRPSNAGVGLPAYQRVGAATSGSSTAAGNADYDTTGFPYYLRFDGTDDSLSSASIDFTSTDKMTVFAGVRKLSDVASAIIAELSAGWNSNNGAFALFASSDTSGTAGGFYRFGSRGDAGAASGMQVVASGYTAPITNVLTATGNISGDLATMRVNAVAMADATGDQGAGNFGNYPLYIGSRAGSSLRFNGHIYSLIVRGASTDAATITATETWVNGKTNAYGPVTPNPLIWGSGNTLIWDTGNNITWGNS